MDQQDKIDRAVESLHGAMLGDAGWVAASALIDEALGTQGMHLVVVDRDGSRAPPARPEWLFDRLCFRGELRLDLAKLYVERYFSQDERIPRFMRLPDEGLVHVTKMFTEPELNRSPTYNEALRMSDCQDGWNARMDGPDGLDILIGIADPVAADGWNSADIESIRHILGHIRQFVRVRHALVRAEALGLTFSSLLDNNQVGVVFLNRRGRILDANGSAREILRQGDGLSDRDGVLRARLATDDARLGRFLDDALAEGGRQAASGSMSVERSPLLPRLVVHVNPVCVNVDQLDIGARSAAALVLIVDPGNRLSIDADLVAETLRLTRAESQVAVALAEGSTVREIAKTTFRAESTVRWLIKQIHSKLGISRQADLVRLVLSAR